MVRLPRARPRVLAIGLAAVLASIALAPGGGAQLPPTPLDPLLQETQKNATGYREATLGPRLTREVVDVRIDMEFRDVDLDTVNVVFGGGKFSAAARIDARIDLRVLAASRLQRIADNALPGAGNLTVAAGAGESFIPADAFRASLTGEALAAFEAEQEARLAEYIRETIPNVTVMSTRFEWSNTSPEDSLERRGEVPRAGAGLDDVNDPTLPPITLRASLDVQYLERTSLIGIVEKAMENRKSEREKAEEERVADAAATYERSAFGFLGIRQVLALQAPEGWNLQVRVRLPEGFTFEEASPDVALGSDLREADVLTLGRDAEETVLNPVALTLSNRFIVSTALLGMVLLAGAILRFPVLLLTNVVRRRLRA